MKIILDLGIGLKPLNIGKDLPKYLNFKKEDTKVIGLDMIKTPFTDIVCDFNEKIDYPSDSVDLVWCRNAIEHIKKMNTFMNEIHRVLKKGGMAIIITPHVSSFMSFCDTDHIYCHFTYHTFDEFCYSEKPDFLEKMIDEHISTTNKRIFKCIRKKIIWTNYRYLRFLNFLFNTIINAMPNVYERFFMWTFPSEILYVEMIKE